MTVDLGNGTVITAILNGTDFVTDTEISESTFSSMETVTITDNGESTTIENPSLVHCGKFEDGYHFHIRELSAQEINAANVEAQIFYTAVTTDTLMEV